MKKLFTSVISIAFLVSVSAYASGISKPVQVGPKAIGMGGAFVAIADDPTAIYHNPAGMTQLSGHTVEVGMDSLITDEDYTPPGGTTESAKTEIIPVPQFGYVSDGIKPIYWGLGVFFPHGNGGTFESPSAVAANPDEGRIYSMEISPAVAFELFKGMSIGGSVRIVRASSTLKNQIFAIGTTTDLLQDLDVSGWGLGGAFGALYRLNSHFSIGANYRSRVKVNVDGNAQFLGSGNLGVSYDQELPSMVTAGISVHPWVDRLTLGLSYGFEANSEIDTLNISLQGAPAPIPYPQNFKNSHTIHFGGEYWLFPTIAFRAGYAKDLNESIPDTTMNRIIGDIAAHEVSAGLAYKWDRYQIGGTWNARFGERDVNPGAGVFAPGNYKAFVNMLSMAFSATL